MTRITFALALLFIVSGACFAQAPGSPGSETLEQELTRIARERILEFDKGDKAVWSSYVADGYIIATPSGPVRTLADVTGGFGPPQAGYRDVFSFEDVHVTRDGDTAIMSYVINEYEFWDDQKYVVPRLRKTDTYVRRNGRWLILGSQETFIAAEPTAIKVNSAVYREYAGRYRLMRSLAYSVSTRNGKLFFGEEGKSDERELLPMGRDIFFSKGQSGKIVFKRDRKGVVTSLLIRDNNYDIRVAKLGPGER